MEHIAPKTKPEPQQAKSDCPYCANAPVNHKFAYLNSIISLNVDPHIAKATKLAPKFVKRFVDKIPSLAFPILGAFRIAKFSDDIERAVTFRSRVIWEEAKRRNLGMQQVILLGKPLEVYRAKVAGKLIYFESLPVPPKLLDTVEIWDRDNKAILKRIFEANNIPVPKCAEISVFTKLDFARTDKIFENFMMPIIVKPMSGSRGRHTTTNIRTPDDFKSAVKVATQISPYLIVEEHLEGEVCRATVVDGTLAGFYRGGAPTVVGDGRSTIGELIEVKNKTKSERVGAVEISPEIIEYIGRSGFTLDSVPSEGERVRLTYRTGRFFGGETMEMIDALHPSFVPILEKAGLVAEIPVAGFDCIIPDPLSEASSQKWGIIECNTLPFIDLHYYALLGTPRNIAGMVWDLWDK